MTPTIAASSIVGPVSFPESFCTTHIPTTVVEKYEIRRRNGDLWTTEIFLLNYLV